VIAVEPVRPRFASFCCRSYFDHVISPRSLVKAHCLVTLSNQFVQYECLTTTPSEHLYTFVPALEHYSDGV